LRFARKPAKSGKNRQSALALAALLATGLAAAGAQEPANVPDPRHISNGHVIPGGTYCDQPYIVKTDDGAWLCVLTTGAGHEGEPGQHVVSLRSTDHGRAWSAPVPVEPANGPEASYAVLLKVPSGRVYCFYNHNTDNVREVKREDAGVYKRVDSLGHYVFKYTEDGGRTWSPRRYEVPVREFAVDRNNVYGGKLRFFWNVGRPLVLKDGALLTLHKVGAMGQGFFAQSEGAFLWSRNIRTERDPEKITWETLPEGDTGLRTPPGGGRVAEEQSVTALSDGSLFCVYRSVDGYPVHAYSRNGGRTWSQPEYLAYSPGGRRVKHPRAANFVWRCGNGKYLYWFHNHGGSPARQRKGWDPYFDRNPAWLTAGEERDGPDGKVIHWSQPEILLYDDDPFIRMSYPDLVEEDGRFWITETQKNIGHVHALEPTLLAGLFNQFQNRAVAKDGLLLDRTAPFTAPVALPPLPAFHQRDTTRPDYGGKDLRAGFSLDLWLRLGDLEPEQPLVSTRTPEGRGILLETAPSGTLRLTLSDGVQQSTWISDPGLLRPGRDHHVVATVDGGPKIITWVIDGVLNDGGEHRQFGWGRFSPTLRDANGAAEARVGEPVRRLRLYRRPLRTSEAVGNYRAGAGEPK
jgi:hypothetical protein